MKLAACPNSLIDQILPACYQTLGRS